MKKPRIDMRLVTPKEQAKPSILKEPEKRRVLETRFLMHRRTVTFSLYEDVLELLHTVKYETGRNYNQIIEDALRQAYPTK
jgi:hypothetical protein